MYIVFTIKRIDMLSKIFTLSLLVLFTSCNSTKETVQEAKGGTMNNEQSDDSKAMDAQMLNDGFHLGEIMHLKNSKCEYIIVDLTTKAKFDPINISEEIYKVFKEDNLKIYYKYGPLRMMNRCPDANPIQLTDIKKREG